MRSILLRSLLASLGTSALGLVIGCTPMGEAPNEETTQPIIGGEIDTGDPSVVAVFGRPPGSTSGFLCTGSVIAPTVVLTAAHCVSPEETGPGATFVVLTRPDLSRRGGEQLAVKTVHANPLWRATNLPAGHDVGVVILQEPTSLTPLPINRAPIPDSAVGTGLRLVGYGLDDGYEQTGSGVKRQVLTKLRSVSAALLRVGDRTHGTCNGDSGGPGFMNIDGVETIVGTTSYGNFTCSDGGYDARVDADLPFLDQFLVGSCAPRCQGRSCGSDGCGGSCGACAAGATCADGGRCVSPATGCGSGGREQEPNDSVLKAGPLCAGGQIRGTLSTASDQDWFTWTVTAGWIYDVRLTAGAPDAVVRVYKILATGNLSYIGDGPVVTRRSAAGGNYVARIASGGSAGANYTLAVALSH